MENSRTRGRLPGGGLYFGWRVVAALFLCTLALFGVSIFSFIILTTPMAAEFGWTTTQSGMLISAMYLVAPLALLAGPMTRRVPPWRLIVAGLCVQAVAMALLGHISSILQLYLLRVFMGLGKIMTASAAPILVARWFSRRFATAVALVWAGGSAGGFIMSPLTEALVSSLGWRHAALAIAAIVLLLTAIAALLARGAASPAEFGLGLDGDPPQADRFATHLTPASADPSPATRSINPFVAITMMLAIVGAGMTSLGAQAQQPTLLRGAGLSADLAAAILGMTAAGSLIGSASIGVVLDRLSGRRCGLLVSAAIYLGLAGFYLVLYSHNALLAVLGAVSIGYGFGSGEVMWITLTKRQFGENAFPFTYGGFYFSLQLGYALGGGIAGMGLEHFGPTGLLALLALLYLAPLVVSQCIRAARSTPAHAVGI
jgi:MFS family permease